MPRNQGEIASVKRPGWRWVEFAVLYLGLPVVYVMGLLPFPPVPLLVVVTGVLVVIMLRDPAHDNRSFWDFPALRREWKRIVLVFLICAPGIALFTWLLFPELLFEFPREYPLIWIGTVLFYPLTSVYPQELTYRMFFYYRYGALFPHPAPRIAVNAAVFGFMHIAFENWVAVALTAFGGLFFAYTYERSRSALAVSVEHALYGLLMFTIGLGRFFFSGVLD